MNVTGANTTELLQLEKRLVSMIERLDGATARGPGFLGRLSTNWLGPLADLFGNAWQHTDLPSINHARDSLHQLKEQLAKDREDQERTSSDSSSAQPVAKWGWENTAASSRSPFHSGPDRAAGPDGAPGPDAGSYNGHTFRGERADLFDSMNDPSASEFKDLVAQGSIAKRGQQTRYFETTVVPGDGVIVTEFVIQEETSGFFLKGDNRPLTRDPLGIDRPLDESRMIVIIDRETGRGVITAAPTKAVFDVDIGMGFQDPVGGFPGAPIRSPLVFGSDNEVGARPISFEGRGLTDVVPDNYFDISADKDKVHIDYDGINSVTAFGQMISVDGPIVLERGADGGLQLSEESSPDLYPAISVTQYKPDGPRETLYFEEGKNVFEGASPAVPAEAFEGIRETGEEFGEAWNQTGDAPWLLKPWEVIEGGGEITYQAGEGIVQTADQALSGGELTEGAGEINEEFNEAKREYQEAKYYRKPDQAIEGGFEMLYETGETSAEFVFQTATAPVRWFS